MATAIRLLIRRFRSSVMCPRTDNLLSSLLIVLLRKAVAQSRQPSIGTYSLALLGVALTGLSGVQPHLHPGVLLCPHLKISGAYRCRYLLTEMGGLFLPHLIP